MAMLGDDRDDDEFTEDGNEYGDDDEFTEDGMDISDKNLLIQLLMNQQLSAGIPITSRIFDKYKTEHYQASSVALQGYRDNMEDEHLIHFNLCNNYNTNSNHKISIFAVFDGHGGDLTSKFIKNTLITTLNENIINYKFDDKSLIKCIKQLEEKWIEFELTKKHLKEERIKKQQEQMNREAIRFTLDGSDLDNFNRNDNDNDNDTYNDEYKEEDYNFDDDDDGHPMNAMTTNEFGTVGSTIVFSIVEYDKNKNNYKITTVNLGDSRAILLKKLSKQKDDDDDGDEDMDKGKENKYKLCELTSDHKPDNEEETQRIIKAGGFVKFNRVDGDLALSRAIGDTKYKQNVSLPAEEQKISCVPMITREIASAGDYLMIFCDGIVEYKDNDDVFEFITSALQKNNVNTNQSEHDHDNENENEITSICSHLRETELNYLSQCESLSGLIPKSFKPKHNTELCGLQKILLDLTDWALESGSKDNMTTMLIKFGKTSTTTTETEYQRIWSPCDFYQHKIQFNNMDDATCPRDPVQITLDRFMRLFEADCSAIGWDMSIKYQNALLQKILYVNDLITNYKQKYDIKKLIDIQNNKLTRLEQQDEDTKEEKDETDKDTIHTNKKKNKKKGIKRKTMDGGNNDDFGYESPRKRRKLSE